ncbi:MAG TPA: hypothetical protein VFV50_12650 [Bdellovibrionales bacterium]|nr:hypothetical protein [Bdellovibrionales bacterium]
MARFFKLLSLAFVVSSMASAASRAEEKQRLDAKSYYQVMCEVEGPGFRGQRHFSGWVSPEDVTYGPHNFRNHPSLQENENVVRMNIETHVQVGNYGEVIQGEGTDWRGNYRPAIRAATYDTRSVNCVSSIPAFESAINRGRAHYKYRVCEGGLSHSAKRILDKNSGCKVEYR